MSPLRKVLPIKRQRRGDSHPIAAVGRAARLLEGLAAAAQPVALPEIAQTAGLSRPTAFRLLASLAGEGLVRQEGPEPLYAIGFLPFALADTVLAGLPIAERARPVLRQIRDETGETVVLSIRRGDWRYNIASAESAHAIKQQPRIGEPIPLYAGAASRILLAGLDEEALAAYLGRTELMRFTPTTPISAERLRAELERIRREGAACSDGEYTRGGQAVAVGVLSGGRVAAALHASVPKGRHSPALEARCLAALKRGTSEISA